MREMEREREGERERERGVFLLLINTKQCLQTVVFVNIRAYAGAAFRNSDVFCK